MEPQGREKVTTSSLSASLGEIIKGRGEEREPDFHCTLRHPLHWGGGGGYGSIPPDMILLCQHNLPVTCWYTSQHYIIKYIIQIIVNDTGSEGMDPSLAMRALHHILVRVHI